jgi:hypothetical protein
MHDDDEFLLSIPPFLRRNHESPRRKLPIRPRDLPKPAAAPAEASAPISHPAPQPAPKSAPKPAPTAATATPTPVPASKPAAPAAQRARIALAFENQDIPETPDLAEGKDDEDIIFQVSLPRGVVREISMLAAKRDSTQRAVVLRALRLAGLSVPDGSDIDHPSHGAKRQA